MKKFNKVLSVLLVLVLSISLLFVYTGADDVLPEEPVVQEETEEAAGEELVEEETEAVTEEETTTEPETSADMSLMDAVHTEYINFVNPLYTDVLSEDDLVESPSEMFLLDASEETVDTLEDAGSILRSGLATREEVVHVYINVEEGYFVGLDFHDFFYDILTEALIETDDPTCGDYLRFQIGGYRGSYSYNMFMGVITYTMTYYTTPEQENEMNGAVDAVLASLDLAGKDEDYKITKIYDYITSHVVYDNANLNDSTYLLKYTGYAALINGTAVCQGYAILFYRLCREAGLSSRVISGRGAGGNHAWNIVRIGSLYYNVDSTWDAEESPADYGYFLRCDANFVNHTRGTFNVGTTDYTSAEFYAVYPMSETDHAYPESAKVAVSAVNITSTCLYILPTETCTVYAEVLPADAYDQSITWTVVSYTLSGYSKHYNDTYCTITPKGNNGYLIIRADASNGVSSEPLTIVVSPEPHVHTEQILPAVTATCTEPGLTEGKKCSVCGETIVAQEVVPALGHAIVHHDAKAATCTESGWAAYDTCSRCDYSTYTEIPATGHTEQILPAVAATCTEPGLTEGKKCSVCGETLVAQTAISALGHAIVHHNAKAPTCTEIGWGSYDTCSRCDFTTYEEIPAFGHAIVHHNAKAPTCTESGWAAYDTCSRCDYSTYTEIPATGHTEQILPAVEATCTEPGLTEGKKCSVCGETIVAQETIPALGHAIVHHNAKAATCTEIGWGAYDTCSRCDYTTYEEIPAHGHTEQILPAVAATCTEPGLTEGKKCSVCGETLVAQEVVPALGHAIVHHDAKAATCTESGWAAYDTCSRCDYTTYAEIPALGHNMGDWVTTTEPGPGVAGERTRTCTRCGYKETETIPPTSVGNPYDVIHYNGKWTYLGADGNPDYGYYGIATNSNGTWIITKGIVTFSENGVINGMDGNWYYVKSGQVQTSYTGIRNNSNGWWRIVNGKVDFGAEGVFQNENGWWYVKNGKVQFNYTGIRPNSNGWWRIVGGKVDFSAEGVFQNENGWWYVKGGKVQFGYTGIKPNSNGWWRIVNGKVDFNANGLFSNENGTWLCQGGKVNFNYNGYYAGRRISGGKVVG